MEGMQIVVFSLNDEVCGVDSSQVKEIVKYEEVSKMPRMPRFIDGVINLRGKVVPIVNLNKRFRLGDMEVGKKTKIIITDIEDKLIGFVVNDVFEIIRLSADDIEPTPEIIKKVYNDYLKCVGKKDDKLISILDLSVILTDSEIGELEENKEDEDENSVDCDENDTGDDKQQNEDNNVDKTEESAEDIAENEK
ncbi:chemotaxis protein CheW [Acetivibrio straminisolvens]|uniref:Positive regulator of CheA protein activity n=1 Tax=Acetivibrio straminisolvens JCM 21531 TaxID=1294263 RepID=W4VBT9_9FIRM|nr:chemotaxis protein CheW [Acetivibrio straminisolvens]GAE90219.1 positive regulator of CheA protein activity [Acetivibrio straminisolvens JCM 21531]